MTSAQHSRYSLNNYSAATADLRLPSLKDLNFYRPAPQDNPQQEFPQDNVARHGVQWARSMPPAAMHPSMQQQHQPQQQQQQQQHSPPSASHDMTAAVEYGKHDGVYARPGMPLSAQMTPVPGSVNVGPATRGDDAPPHSPHQVKRGRPSSTISAAREGRPAHNGYGAQYYQSNQPPPNSPYHQLQSQNHSASPHEQLSHPAYNGYQQQQYLQSRQPTHPQHPSHPPHHQPIQHQPPSHAGSPQHPMHVQPSHPPPPQPPSTQSSSLIQPAQSSQLAHHTPAHQLSHSHQPLPHQSQQQLNHGNTYSSPNPAVHPPQSPWGQQNHTQQSHHQPLGPPSHSQQPPVHSTPHPHPSHPSHPHPPQAPAHHQHQQSAVPPSTPQTMMQQPPQHQHQQPPQHSQQQHHAPPPQLPPSQAPPPHHPPQHHPQQHSQPQTSVAHHPNHSSLPPPPPQQHQQQQMPFARTTPLVPTSVESRPPPTYTHAAEPERAPDRNDPMSEIVKHCNDLYSFANHYVTLQQNMPHMHPSSAELQDMSQKALQVVRLLEDFKRVHVSESERLKMEAMQVDDHRPPKRPWEDLSDNSNVPNGDVEVQSTAEQDMQIIRNKRATSTAGAATSAGQVKNKYRKRSRATPPGRCHSCNIRETPEWRRGPDGARTLCNACGLHYAKLIRKRDKNDPTGQTPRIDLETLRASARAAESADKSRSKTKGGMEPSSPDDTKPNSQLHHQGSFQLMNVMAQDPSPLSNNPERTIPPPPAATIQTNTSLPVPPPPWATSQQQQPPPSGPPASHGRAYAPEHLQHQSFMRTSQHPSIPQASAR